MYIIIYIMPLNIFIFRRDYRLYDNIGLIETLENYKKVLPIFIGTPEQLVNNEYKSNFCVQFLYESLNELSETLISKKKKLYCFFGDNISVLKKIISKNEVESINYNKDYTPYAVKRDEEINKFCDKNGIECNEYHDYLLVRPGVVLTLKHTPYKVYGQFQKKEVKMKIDKPINLGSKELKRIYAGKINGIKVLDTSFLKKYFKENNNINKRGGRDNALKILGKIGEFGNYSKCRNELSYKTTELSAYIKFGCISIRETYWAFKNKIKNESSKDGLINQLIWRDFYYDIMYYFPKNMNESMRVKFRKFKWVNNKKWFKAWCEGKTGFPIVDAGMRQLNSIGYMHNRARLITSNFLTRILICDWKWGERYYAQNLSDYDPSVNNGNWQWGAGTGTDTAPFSQRIFNPWLQSNKFDLNCEYIKKWVPELKDIPNQDIHKWDVKYKLYIKDLDYPEPIVNYKKQREEVKRIYKEI